jgi:hypothetical protein
MRRTKSTACHEHMITTNSSNSDDDMSLGADQEEAPALTHDTVSSRRWCPFTARSILLQVQDTLEGQPFNVSLF